MVQYAGDGIISQLGLQSMFYRSFGKAKLIFTQFLRKNSPSIHNKLRAVSLSLLPLWWLIGSERMVCAQKESQVIDDILQKVTVTMQELVKLLNQQSGQDFVIIVYNKFEKSNHPEAFGLQLKAVLQQCKDADVSKVYAITSKDEQYLRQIERRIKNQPIQANQQQQQPSSKKKQVIDCYYKSRVYSQAFQLVNTKQYSISEQIKQIKHFEITTNSDTLHPQLLALNSYPFDINKNIVVKQCRGKGECVESYKHAVKKLIDSGLLIRKTDQYQFELVIDYPTGLLSKPSEYIRNFEACASKVANRRIKHRKEETYLFSRDILGREVRLMSEWAEKQQNNYDDESLLMMFIRPRVNIISKLNTLTDLQWYFLTNRQSRTLSLSLNNTDKCKKTNSRQSLQVLKMLQSYYPQLNLLIINSTAAGDIINHVHADHKYVVFSESSDPIWNKKFIDLDQLQKLEGREQKERVFKQKYKPQLDAFIRKPQAQDLVVAEKELEVSLQRLKQWKQQQQSKLRIVRVCEERCLRFLNQDTIRQLQKKLNQKLKVYWIDNRTQNVGVKVGDYLLKDGKLYDIVQLLAS